jgi:hypothetical protein
MAHGPLSLLILLLLLVVRRINVLRCGAHCIMLRRQNIDVGQNRVVLTPICSNNQSISILNYSS